MPLRAKILVATIVCGAMVAFSVTAHAVEHSWWIFAICLAAALLSSGFKVPRLSGSGSMSLNYPFVFLALVQLSPSQAFLIAALSTAVQCRLRQRTVTAVVQIVFNIANSICSTAAAYACYYLLLTHHAPLAPSLTVAACTYFLSNTLPVAFAIGWSSKSDPMEIWRSEFTWFLPFYIVGAVLAAAADLALIRFGWSTAALLVPVVYTLFRSYVGQVNRLEERRKHLEETEALHLRTIEGLAMAVEAKDQNTHDHLFRVRDYVAKVATLMDLDDMQKKALQTASFLHDIGKLAVPEHIINKPGKLTIDEFEKMKIHPVVGADILERVRFPYPVVPIVRSHHERWDGQGYPDGLAGEAIPVGARILSVVDCFDALASDRPYRKALPLPKAMEIVRSMAGTQFDPHIVSILEQCYVDFEKTYQEPGTFQALNLALDVQRGIAPGAGFERANTYEEKPARQAAAEQDTYLESIARAAEIVQAKYELSRRAGSWLTVADLMTFVSSGLRDILPFDCCALYLKDDDVVVPRYVDPGFRRFFTDASVPLGEGLSGWVVQSGFPILNGNAHVEPVYIRAHAGETRPELASALAVPLCNPEGTAFGVLTLYSCETDRFSKGHLRVLQSVEAKLSLALLHALEAERGRANSENNHNGYTSRMFLHTLSEELCRQHHTNTCCAVIVCGLHWSSAAEKRRSDACPETLIQSFTEHLQQHCRRQDTIMRISSNECAVLMPDLQETPSQDRLACVSEALAAACKQTGGTPHLAVSYGVAFSAEDGGTPEELLAHATRRMVRHERELDCSGQSLALKPFLVAS